MKLRISQEELQLRTVFLATPMFGGQCYGLYANSLMKLAVTFCQQGLKLQFCPVFNESLVPRARNTLANEFMCSGMSHFLFIDADIEFTPEDVLTLLVLASPKSDKDIICGLYPKKHICWDKIEAAVSKGEEPDQLENFMGEMVFNPEGLSGSYDLNELLEVKESGTGFMMIQRRVFERFIDAYPEQSYLVKGGREYCFFDSAIGKDRYLSEDYNFCQMVNKIGCKIWVAPWLNLNHLGYFKFIGNASAVSSLVDPSVEVAEAIS